MKCVKSLSWCWLSPHWLKLLSNLYHLFYSRCKHFYDWSAQFQARKSLQGLNQHFLTKLLSWKPNETQLKFNLGKLTMKLMPLFDNNYYWVASFMSCLISYFKSNPVLWCLQQFISFDWGHFLLNIPVGRYKKTDNDSLYMPRFLLTKEGHVQ